MLKVDYDNWNYELGRLSPKVRHKKVNGSMKYEWGGRIMTIFVELRKITSSYLIDDGSKDKKTKSAKNCVMKRKLKFGICKNCLDATQLENRIHHQEKNKIIIDSLKKS